MEGTERFKERTGLMTAPVCIAPEEIEDGRIPICVWNISAKPIRVYREQSAATVEELPAKVIPQTATTREYDPVPEVQIGKQLNDSEVTRVKNLLRENADVFDYPGNEGYTTTETYTIPTGDAEPITCPPRRHNLSLTEKINEAVEKHLKAGHIKPSRSSWAFPIVPVMKPDMTVRLCVDYKPLNNVTQSDAFPTGNINEVLDNIVGAQYFSVIDLAQGYLQVPLAEKDQAKIAFRSPTGFWEWTRMCYGLKGSPATFARLMRNVVNQNPPERLALYMDDLCVVSKTFDDHVRNLQQVFDALRQHGLRIKAKKCALVMREVKFLGHRVTKDGVQPAKEKVEATRSWPAPVSVKEVQKFLGVTGCYRKFIKNFSEQARPLTKLLEKNATFIWNKEQEDAFTFLKNCLTTAPVLAHPKPNVEFVVTTDAKSTNHKPLLKMLEVKDPFGRRATMLRDISEFEPQLEFIKGCDNVVADAMSRLGITPLENHNDEAALTLGMVKSDRIEYRWITWRTSNWHKPPTQH